MKSIRIYKRMLGFIRPYIAIFILSSILSILIASLDGISLWFLGSLPQALFNPDAITIPNPEFSIGNINAFLKYWTYKIINSKKGTISISMVCILIVLTFTAKNLFIYINKIVLTLLNLNIVRDIRNKLYRHILMIPVSYYDKNKPGKITALIVNDVNRVNRSMTDTLSKLFLEPIRLIFFIIMCFIISVKLTLMVFAIYPVLIFIIVKIGRSVRRRSKRMLESFTGMISVLTETVGGIRVVKMFNMNDAEYTKFKLENRKFINKSFNSEKIKAFLSPFTETLAMYITAILLWYGGNKAISGSQHFSAEDFFRFLFFLFSSYQPLKSLGTVNNSIQVGIAAAERLFKLLAIPKEDLRPISEVHVPLFNSEISFSHVDFKYPGSKKMALSDVNITVNKGEAVAIVGSSGAGKTTILDLLPRFYEINKGSITIDGVDIRNFDLSGLRCLFGIVSQETILFNDTVRNNIAYGLEDVSADKIKEAATAANAIEFIDKLPNGMDTVIGERGAMLSGGEKQRLAIARALLKNPPVLILDEATSSLDTESERLVQKAINNLIKNRTALIVAHRLSTIQNADKIIVIEGGHIVEEGTHEQLIALNKRYKYLHDIQFANQNK